MRTREALNVAYSMWWESLTPEGREELDQALAPAEDVAESSRAERIAAAMAVPVDA